MPAYDKPLVVVRDMSPEKACCTSNSSCDWRGPQPPPPQEQCGAGWNNNGGSFTIAYNFGDNCGSYQFGYFQG